MVAAVGYQTENNWIDLINIELLETPAHPLLTANTTGYKTKNFTYPWPSVTSRITLDSGMNTNWTYGCFVSSFQGAFATPGDRVNLWFGLAQIKTTTIVFKLDAAQYVSVKTYFGGIIFFKYIWQPVGIEYYSMSLQFMYNQPNDIFKTTSKVFGPPFNGKCLITTYFFQYRSALTLELLNSAYNNYYKVAITPSTSFQINVFSALFCISSMSITECGQFEYEDPMTNACFDNGTACPIPTPTSLAEKKWCLKCAEIQCLTCDATNRSFCFDCDSTLFTTVSSGACICIATYGRIISPMSPIGACALCSSAVPNCIRCNTVGGCSLCITGLFYNSSAGFYGTCQDCATYRPNCAVCATDGKCSQCIANYWLQALGSCLDCPTLHPNCLTCDPTDGKCTQCVVGYGITSSGDCTICSTLYTNCIECLTDTGGCTLCFTDAFTQYWLDSLNQCVNCQTIRPHCTTCSPPPDNACTTCDLGFGITASDDCDTCSTLYSNCLLCASYDTGCNQCAVGFGIDLSTHCDTCSFLYSPECLECVNYSDGCTKCITGYGIDSTGQCIICSTLYSNCNLCTSYNTGCAQCQATYGLNSSSQCQPCQVLYTNCNSCLSYNGGCNECKSTYGIDSSGMCSLCSSLIVNCQICTSYNTGCTQCSSSYVLGPMGQCFLCSSYYPNCDSCTTYNGGCTLCMATYGITSFGQCDICTSFYSDCVKCDSYNSGCTQCSSGFGITSSGQCAACPTLYNANCLLCVSYNGGCTSCKIGFGYDSLGQCTACSTLYPNCLLCASYNTGCISCSSGYGISLSGSCQLCSAHYPNCAICTSHDTGCTQCNTISNVYLLSSKLCKTCSEITPECISCQPNGANSDLICTQCARGYYLNSSQNSCIQCSTAIVDCDECYFNTTVSKVRCTFCSDQYLVDDRFLCQKCKIHIYYERMCYYLPGCSSLAVINNTLICLACTLPNFEFSIKIKKCTCQKGYNFSTVNDTCNGNCGDALKVPTEDCDDGNLINGDGCNDLCKIETNYKCEENNNSKSVCIFTQDIKITFDYIMKIEGENKAQIYFSVEPATAPIIAIDWQKTINLSFIDLTKKPVVSFSYENGVLIVSLVYFEDLEGKFCEMDAKFNQSLIVSKSQYLYFQIKASNAELKYSSQSLGQTHKTVGIISFALGIMALVFFVTSNYFHKLIGLETIQFIQLIYFSRIVFSGDAQSNVLAFNSLKYSNGYSEINLSGAKANANAAEIPQIFFKIQLQMYYLDNCNTMIIPIILATVGYALYFVRKTRALSVYKETKQISIRDNIVEMGRKITWIYENAIFPYTLSLLYLTLFQMLVYQLSDLSDQSGVSSFYVRTSFSFSLLILVYIFFIFCAESVSGFKDYINAHSDKSNKLNEDQTLTDERHKDHHPLYVPFYLLYQLFLLILVNTALLNFIYLTQVMAGLILLYSIVFLCWKPYALKIHNHANIYNQTVLMMFFALQILGKQKLLNETLSMVSLYGTLSLIVVALAIQMARVYVCNKSEKRKFNVESETKKKSEALKIMKPKNLDALEIKISQMIKKSEKRQNDMNDMLDTTILGREELRKRLRQQQALDEKNNSLLKSKQSEQIEDDKERLRKLKQRMRRGQKPHQEWIFK